MSKPTNQPNQPAETVEFQAIDPSKAADQFRAVAEKGVEQSKEALAKFQFGAEETQIVLKPTFETAGSVGNELSLTTIAALRANVEGDFSHFEAQAGAKSLSEVIADHIPRQARRNGSRAGQGFLGAHYQGGDRYFQIGQGRLRGDVRLERQAINEQRIPLS
ncbi:hypothetical protein ACVJBD_007291 [Rhizobium mongolense]